MKEAYRIKKGTLTSNKYSLPFDFGLIFEEEGVFLFDFYISDSFDLNSLIEKEYRDILNQYFVMTASTEDHNLIEATFLFVEKIIPHKSKLIMQCNGYLLHSEVGSTFNKDKEEKSEENERQTLYYIELEGLKMNFYDLTETIRARGGVKIEDFMSLKRDHSTAMLFYEGNLDPEAPCNSFKITFFKSNKNDNIIAAFPKYEDVGPNVVYYDRFKVFKEDFRYLLSLLNGAEVKIRKEFIGGFYSGVDVNSQTVITYSYKFINNQNHNGYVPLNNGFYLERNILNHTLIHCFNKYVSENKTLDLNSIVFYLNKAEQSTSIEESFFILIIAFERLAHKYVSTLNEPDKFLIPDNIFQAIKNDLIGVLNSYSNIIGDKLNPLSSKVGEIHIIKKTSTAYKFLKLLEYSNIPINKDIQNIIDVVRHKSIHQGEIGDGNQGLTNYFVLDQLLRDIILNIIGYDQARITRLMKISS
ncbi:MAG: hypothetical protein WAS55_13370 [Saprospiraceae bacterium]